MDRRSFFKLVAFPAALAAGEPILVGPAEAYTIPPERMLAAVNARQNEGWRIEVVLGAEGKPDGLAAREPVGMTPCDRHVRYFEVMQGICPMQTAELLYSAGWPTCSPFPH